MARHASGRSIARLTLVACVLLAAVAAGWWAGRVTFRPSQAQNSAQQAQLVTTVQQTTVGQSLTLNVTVTQPFQPLAPALLAGIVTAAPPLNTAKSGQVLYRVNDIPVRAVQGRTPFYRPLRSDESGPDVSELQATLIALGDLRAGAPSGVFDATTGAAVKKWQDTLGQPQTGAIALGELIAVPKLPAPLRLGDGVVLGAMLDGSFPAALAPTGILTFQLIVSQQQAALIPSTATIDIRWQSHLWPAIISSSNPSPSDSSTIVMGLTANGGGLPCADECSTLPPNATMSLLASVQVIPQTSGPAVPAAALHTDAQGHTYVLMADGSRRPVTVKTSANGVVII